MIIYCGLTGEAMVLGEVNDLGCGAGLTSCVECEGTGTFIGHPEGPENCVSCKGTGKIYVSV